MNYTLLSCILLLIIGAIFLSDLAQDPTSGANGASPSSSSSSSPAGTIAGVAAPPGHVPSGHGYATGGLQVSGEHDGNRTHAGGMEASPASQSQGQGQALQEHAQRRTEVEAALLVVDQRIDQVRTQLYIAREGFTEAKKKNRITSGAIAIERHLRQLSVLQAERQRLLSERR